MSTPFNLPSIRRDPLGQALDRLPQFLLTLGQMQERRGEREERALRANEQEKARKEAREMEFLRMYQQTDPDVQVAGIEGLQDFLETRSGRRAGAIVANNARERQRQKRLLETGKAREDKIQDLMDLVKSGTSALAQGQIGAEDIVTAGMNELSRIMGIGIPEEVDTTIVDDGGTLGLDLREAGLTPRIRQVAGREEFIAPTLTPESLRAFREQPSAVFEDLLQQATISGRHPQELGAIRGPLKERRQPVVEELFLEAFPALFRAMRAAAR